MSSWHVGDNQSHFDPLLDCLVELTKLHGNPLSREALSAGLPLVNNRLTPGLLARAAGRGGLSARVIRRPLKDIANTLLPAILLLDGRQACLLHEVTADGHAKVSYPEVPGGMETLSLDMLSTRYTGQVAFVRPKFRFDHRAPELGHVRARHWFWGAMLEARHLYRDALLSSVLVNVFALAFPLFSMTVYDRVVPNHALETLWVLAIGALLVLVFDFAMRVLRGYVLDVASKRIDVQLSSLIMERVLGIRMENRPPSVGSFVANLRSFESVRDFIASASMATLVDLPFVLLFLLVLVWINPWLLLPVTVGIVIVVGFGFVAQAKMEALTETTQRATAQRNATLVESLVGIETLKAMGGESDVQRRWERATVFLSQVNGKLKLMSNTTIYFASFIQQLVSVAVIIAGVYLMTDGQLSMGGLIAAGMISGRAMAPLGQVAGLLMQYHGARTSLGSIENYMKMPVERPADANFLHHSHFKGDIEFRDVTFAYPGRDNPVLKKVSFRIRAGERVAIIGRLGSGKTTIERLLLGLYQPTEGSVTVDGIDVRQIDPAELRRAIGYVPQDVVLFFGTLRENIAVGAPFADDNNILVAADVAGVSEFAYLHPSGFDMVIGERGESLSGGQRQAVAVARALLSDPPMLILDEPTNGMDHTSEERLKARLKQVLASGKTMLLVTHRTALLELVDRLIVIDGGQVVADGPKAQVVEALQQGRIGRA
ncbi:type I secretion system permease/ATPase [Leeia aquatica]|uniref:Cyclolysin secretion/processing ATP-binding protein CyaB n=1 Tax=Leeia aquatica TaxID=2725557 RepID=A0A847S651_9NEIS|nr:type I secretion system permease/ATPase [Leeia aquatica]NLR75354.1 type I secretion system permease/ATPase [Leeia aquatica]